MQEKIWTKNWFLLWQGQAVSIFGGSFFGVAARVWLLEETDSAAVMGLVMMSLAIPTLVFGPLGGAVADRYSKKHILIICDAVNGVFGIALAAILYFVPENKDLGLAALIVVSLVMDISGVFFVPAIMSAVPNLVPLGKLSSGYAIIAATFQITDMIGTALGGVVYRLVGGPILFFFNGVSFLYSAVSESFITIPLTQKEIEHKKNKQSLLKDVVDGIHYFRTRRGMLEYVIVITMVNFFAAPLVVMLPFYVKDYLLLSIDWFGYFSVMMGAGGLLGVILSSRVQFLGVNRLISVFVSWFGVCLFIGLLGFTKNLYIVSSLLIMMGFLQGFMGIQTSVLVRHATSQEMMGRVGSLMNLLKHIVSPVSMGLSGIVFEMIDRDFGILFAGTSGIILVLAFSMLLNSAYRDFVKNDSIA